MIICLITDIAILLLSVDDLGKLEKLILKGVIYPKPASISPSNITNKKSADLWSGLISLLFFIGKDVHQKISVGEEVFYTQYKCIADSNGGMVLVVSPNLEIRLTENKFNFKIQTSLKEVSRDAQFLLGLKSTNSFIIEGHSFQYTNLNMPLEFEKQLRYIVDLFNTLKMIDFDVNIKLSDCTDEQQTIYLSCFFQIQGAYSDSYIENYAPR